MTKNNFDYDVRCKTCFKKFTVQLFENHEKNLWLADNKSWYCEACKKAYFEEQTALLSKEHARINFCELSGTSRQISWAEKIRKELINKVDFLKKSLSFNDEKEKETSERAFDLFLQEWQKEPSAKWWIDNRKMSVRDISLRIKEITDSMP